MATVQELSEAIQKGQAPKAKELTQALLAAKTSAADVMNKGHLDGMEILKSELVKAGVKPIGKILIGTVKGDLHDIGKNLVKMMAQGAGIEVVDCGIDVSGEKFLQAYKDNPDAKAVGMSALMTTTMTGMKEVIDASRRKGCARR
jgi:5-methyltetrahydrofolate--homocysteine methyltransferase